MEINIHERALVIILRGAALLMLAAIFPVLFPFDWMNAIHNWLGLGELPETPIVGYLTRSLSALYAAHGALVLYVSYDVKRYSSLIRFLAIVCIAFGVGLAIIDRAVGLPFFWVLLEGPSVIAMGAAIVWLTVKAEPRN